MEDVDIGTEAGKVPMPVEGIRGTVIRVRVVEIMPFHAGLHAAFYQVAAGADLDCRDVDLGKARLVGSVEIAG